MNENGNGNGNTERRLTGTDLAERGLDALDVTHYENIPVADTPQSGQISDVDWMKVMELGKALSAMKEGMPEHVRGKWGIGCRIAAHAQMWRMDPFGIADQTYMVGNRLGYMSQLIHALINLKARLAHRLECEYIGEGSDLACKVTGTFTNGDKREYTTPKFKDIKIKNSPLWLNDTQQQLWYFGVRSWGRKWCPEVVLGLYTKEELEADETLGYGDAAAPGLSARLKGSPRPQDAEGHRAEHVTASLDQIENAHADSPAKVRRGAQGRSKPKSKGKTAPKPSKRTSEPRIASAVGSAAGKGRAAAVSESVPRGTKDSPTATNATKVSYPSSVAEYLAYARRWLKTEQSKVEIGERWANERKMRNALGVTAEDRAPLEDLMKRRLDE